MENQQQSENSLIIDAYLDLPKVMLEGILALRALIFQQAKSNSKVGEIEESLKWGQPSYASKNKAGTPIRLGIEKKTPGLYGLYVNCSTSLIEDVRHIYGDLFRYDGNRAILFDINDELPEEELCHVINMALTYHLKLNNL